MPAISKQPAASIGRITLPDPACENIPPAPAPAPDSDQSHGRPGNYTGGQQTDQSAGKPATYTDATKAPWR